METLQAFRGFTIRDYQKYENSELNKQIVFIRFVPAVDKSFTFALAKETINTGSYIIYTEGETTYCSPKLYAFLYEHFITNNQDKVKNVNKKRKTNKGKSDAKEC